MTPPIDFDIHGFAGIRLIDATPEDVRVVSRQVGPLQHALEREPDILIHFVDRLQLASPLRYLGVNDVGFTEDAFVVLQGVNKSQVRVQIPFDQIGKQLMIVCERGLPAVPLLIPILNLTILANGVLPLHASAFQYQGCGILVTGWSKGGKTETLLAFMANGAEYIGDEWVYLEASHRQMFGVPEPIRLWAWHLDNMPQYQAKLSQAERTRLRLLKTASQILGWAGDGSHRQTSIRKFSLRALSLVNRQQYVQVPPQRLFGVESCLLRGRIDKVFFLMSTEEPEIRVVPVSTEKIAQRMVFSLQEEASTLLSAYAKFRFAFPEKRNELIDQAYDLQLEALRKVLVGKEAAALYHPYPVHIPALFQAIQPFTD